MNKETVNVSGLLSNLLTVAFIVLKLCHVIDWPWLWVLAPFWVPLALAIVFIIIAAIIKAIVS